MSGFDVTVTPNKLSVHDAMVMRYKVRLPAKDDMSFYCLAIQPDHIALLVLLFYDRVIV